MWMEICQQRVRYSTQRCGEGHLGWLGVSTYAQDLGTPLLEVRIDHSEAGDLVCSASSERVDVEGEDDVFLSPVLLETHVFSRVSWQSKIWCVLSNIYHDVPPALAAISCKWTILQFSVSE